MQQRQTENLYMNERGEVFTESALREFYSDDELNGIGSIFKKIAGVAAPFANFIPGVGPLVSTGLTAVSSIQGAPKTPKADPQAFYSQWSQAFAQLGQQIDGGQVSSASGGEAITSLYKQYESARLSSGNNDKIYAIERNDLPQVLQNLNAKVAAATQREQQAKTIAEQKQNPLSSILGGGGNGGANGDGISTNTLLIGGAVIAAFFLFTRR